LAASAGARDGDALAHAARQLPGIGLREAIDIEFAQQFLGARLEIRQTLDLGRQQDVAEDLSPFEQQVALEDDADVGYRPGDRLAADADRARVGRSSPAIRRSSVLFPQPLGPTMLTASPARSSALIGAMACTPPGPP